MYTTEYRDHVRHRVLELARADPRVTGGALTGSTALSAGDAWSDIDIAFGIAEDIALETVLQDWTQAIDREFSVIDYFDLPAGPSIYRVFLLASGLEVDVAVTPESKFGARGPNFRALFGTSHQLEAAPPPNARYIIGLSWHHVFHARSSIERGKPWKAEYWIREIRDHVLALACIRLGEEAYHARGFDHLPTAVTDPLADTLVRSLDEQELRRALAASTLCLIGELEEWDPALCARLKPLLQEFGAT
ncbi:MAG: hypothetical protein J2P37_21300 [Ktedonobacteraceae bacterium]|nr:hypothetical protein [Ktedonobacteraceae bacterium]